MPKSETLSIAGAARFAEELEKKLIHAAEAAKSVSAPPLSAQLCALCRKPRPGFAHAKRVFEKSRSVSEQLAENTEFGFLVDPARHILSIGYDVRARKVHQACYDMLASEARIATFLAIARGELPNQSWFKLAATTLLLSARTSSSPGPAPCSNT